LVGLRRGGEGRAQAVGAGPRDRPSDARLSEARREEDFPTENFPSSFFTQDVVLYDGIDRVDLVTQVDWWEEHTMIPARAIDKNVLTVPTPGRAVVTIKVER
jgi:hypothetical protein